MGDSRPLIKEFDGGLALRAYSVKREVLQVIVRKVNR